MALATKTARLSHVLSRYSKSLDQSVVISDRRVRVRQAGSLAETPPRPSPLAGREHHRAGRR
jgi:hypothetical protein